MDKHIAVGIAIRPGECLIGYSERSKRSKDISTPSNCLDFIHTVLTAWKTKGFIIDRCVVATIGDVDTDRKVFLGTSVRHRRSAWQDEIDFTSELASYLNPKSSGDRNRLTVLNDATASAYKIYQTYKNNLGHKPFLMISVRQWGIGFGLIYKGRPWLFDRSPELGHIPAVRLSIGGEQVINDIAINVCNFHNCESVPCIANQACGEAHDIRSNSDIRMRLREHFGGRESAGYEFEAAYLAQACVVGSAAYAPHRIVLSGNYVNKDIVERVQILFRHLNKDFPRHRVSPVLSYRSNLDLDIDGAIILAKHQTEYDPRLVQW